MNIDFESSSPQASATGRNQDVSGTSKQLRRNESFGLSVRQNEILLLVSQGHRNKEIADKLGLSVNTVCTHLKQIFEKLHVSSRTAAAARYMVCKFAH
jgi:DNA-binding CsgD family transcriptional regulator